MSKVPHIPSSAPFTLEQRAWLNGYLVGLFSETEAPGEPARSLTKASAEPVALPLLVMYGSQTGTAEQFAKRIAKEAPKHGFIAQVMEMNAFASVDLSKEQRLAIVTSTWGDGDPPDNAAAFWNFLTSTSAPNLEHLHFSILAFGDRNYANFCGAGKKFDERLEQLGATRILDRADCDVDYEATAKAWLEALWPRLASPNGAVREPVAASRQGHEDALLPSHSPAFTPVTGRDGNEKSPVSNASKYGRTNPFPARLLANRRLNTAGSAKDTRHFEISLEGSGLDYQVGDALGVAPSNCPALVGELLEALGCDGEEAVPDRNGVETSLRRALLDQYQITQPAHRFVEAVAGRAADSHLKNLLAPDRRADLEQFLYGREVIDFFFQFPQVRFSPQEFIGLLRKLQPRLYSISSSLKVHPGEVHLTVAAVRYQSHGRERKGVCSTFLADRAHESTTVPVFVQRSHGFRLPNDPATAIIMIGPGTGIAPFRAFLEERRAEGAPGKNWLLFGDQRQDCDFLYCDELQMMRRDGILTRLDLAFSRDQPEKIYVQQRMREHARDLWAWLEEGAHVYVCGDAKRMAKDVDAALREVIQKAGGKTAEQAADYVTEMKTAKRYQRDVY